MYLYFYNIYVYVMVTGVISAHQKQYFLTVFSSSRHFIYMIVTSQFLEIIVFR